MRTVARKIQQLNTLKNESLKKSKQAKREEIEKLISDELGKFSEDELWALIKDDDTKLSAELWAKLEKNTNIRDLLNELSKIKKN